MYYLLYSLNAFVMVAAPLALGSWIALTRWVEWRLFLIGGATFVLSQVAHIPFNLVALPQLDKLAAGWPPERQLLVTAFFVGLSAGLFEEIARYLTYRYWAKGARSWGQGLMLGAGHGGVEAIILGLLAAVNLIFIFGLQSGRLSLGLDAEQLEQTRAAMATLFTVPWYDTILGALERLFALTFHLAASLLVLRAVVRRSAVWLVAAILWHALLDAAAVYAAEQWSIYAAEAAVGVAALISLLIVVALRQPEPTPPPIVPLAPPQPVLAAPAELGAEQLERSRYD
jgi:uncharacterized membrane protein YhfC